MWSTISDALLDSAQDMFEKFVMDQLYDLVFLANEDDETEDLNLAEKIRGAVLPRPACQPRTSLAPASYQPHASLVPASRHPPMQCRQHFELSA